MTDISECKLKTPLGMSLLSGLASDGQPDCDLVDYLMRSSPTPVEAIGLLIRVASVLIVQLDGALADNEVEDCGVVLKETLKHYRGVKMREVVQRRPMQ
jgi:hypothetical protein